MIDVQPNHEQSIVMIDEEDAWASYENFRKSLEPFISNGQMNLPEDLLKQQVYLDIGCFPFWGVRTAPLIASCVQGDIEATKFLLFTGISPNDYEPNVYLDTAERPTTPLQAAARFGHVEIAKPLLERGADINPPENEHGITPCPLPLAALEGQIDMIKFLLSRGADINGSARRNRAALHSAAYFGHVEVVKLLLKRGANVNLSAGDFATPLKAACAARFDNISVIAALLDGGADINDEGEARGIFGLRGSPLVRASSVGMTNAVKLLLERGVDVNQMSEYEACALHISADAGHLEAVEVLIEAGAEVNARIGTFVSPVTAASCGGYPDIVEYVIAKGANTPGCDGKYEGSSLNQVILNFAGQSLSGNTQKIIKLLLNAESGATLRDETGWTAFHEAS